METRSKPDGEVEEEVEKERRALAYLLVGLLVVIAAAYLYSSGILHRAVFWEESGEQLTAGAETVPAPERSRSTASRRGYSAAREPARRQASDGEANSTDEALGREESETQPENERPAPAPRGVQEQAGESSGGTEVGPAGIPAPAVSQVIAGSNQVAMLANKGVSREELRRMARHARARYGGRAEFVLAVYPDTQIGRQLADGSIRNPSPSLVQLNRLLLYRFDPVKGEQFDFSPLIGPGPQSRR